MKQTILSSIIIAALSWFAAPMKSQTVVLERTHVHAAPADFNTTIRLKAGKLIGLTSAKSVDAMTRAKDADLCVDLLLTELVNGYYDSNAKLDAAFDSVKNAIAKSGVEVWGVHLTHTTNKSLIGSADATIRNTAVTFQKKIIRYCMEYIKPQVIVLHPGCNATYLHDYSSASSTGEAHYYNLRNWARTSIVQLQEQLDESNATYGTNAILCVENCTSNVTHDALAALDFLDYPGLEKVKVCFDVGHALTPANGHYIDKTKETTDGKYKTAVQEGDVVTMIRLLGDKLGTLHIQQNHGAIGRASSTFDTHLQPFTGGLVDWGEFYYALLKDIGYRGCFLYEVSYINTYQGTGATLSTVATNYEDVILPAYEAYLQQHSETK